MKQLVVSAFVRAPSGWDEAFQLGRRYVMPLLRPMLSVRRLRGVDGSGRPATIVTAGTQMTVDALVARFLVGAPEHEELGQMSLRVLGNRLRRLRGEADLVLAVVPRAYAGWFGRNYLHVPALVGFEQRVERTTAATLALASQQVRHDARRMPDFGYHWEAAEALDDFHRFYDQFYRPFIRARFGTLAVVREQSVLWRHFRHGGAIVWVYRDGRTIGGELVRRDGTSLHRLVQALAADARGLTNRPSPQLALGVACLELAVGAGITRIGLGGVLPSLRDGVLSNKRAWGASAYQWEANHRTLLVGWSEFGGAQRIFLQSNPLIFGVADRLVAVTATPPDQTADLAAAQQIWRRLMPRGVHRLFLVGADGWAAHGVDGRRVPDGPIVLCPPCSSAELVATAAGRL